MKLSIILLVIMWTATAQAELKTTIKREDVFKVAYGTTYNTRPIQRSASTCTKCNVVGRNTTKCSGIYTNKQDLINKIKADAEAHGGTLYFHKPGIKADSRPFGLNSVSRFNRGK